MRDRLRAGVAIFNSGHYHAAHDAWEDRWLELEAGSDDERLLHGLIQYSGAVYHARERNWEGAVGLAESAGEYLAGCPPTTVTSASSRFRVALDRLAADPEIIERRAPGRIEHEDDSPGLADLGFEPTAIAAVVLAEEFGYDEEPVGRARGVRAAGSRGG